MRASYPVLRLAGIDLKLHVTFPLALVFGAVQWSNGHGLAGAVFGALLVLALFACVALHELGHALAARGVGVGVREVVLLPIGGVALLSKMPRRPLHELWIAVAGPLVNVAIAAVLGVGLAASGHLGADSLTLRGDSLSLDHFLRWLFAANVGLVIFNLVPAFPMDGGRILRALLAMRLGYARATQLAAATGQVLALAMGIFGLVRGDLMLVVVAVFVFFGAAGERAVEESRGLLSTLRLRDAYNRHALTLAPWDRLGTAAGYILTSYQPDFAVIERGELVGVVTREEIVAGLAAGSVVTPVAAVMRDVAVRLDPELSLAETRERLEERDARLGAVYDGHRFLGLVSVDDITEALLVSASMQVAEQRARMRAAA